jgi:trans-aconitate methyltransferase
MARQPNTGSGQTDLQEPKLYGELAEWWPLLSPPEEYAEEAAFYRKLLLEAAQRPLKRVLELGSGGGSNASYLKSRFTMTLVDRSPAMLAISGRLNPECRHIQGDMRTARLDQRFDAVFVHDAVAYITNEPDLKAVMETAYLHCEPGGAALFCPDHIRENFAPLTDHGGYDGSDGRALRYLEWTWDPDPSDCLITTDYAYLIRERDGATRAVHDRHIGGLFSRADWLHWLAAAGFEPSVRPLELSDVPQGQYEVFIAKKSASAGGSTGRC